MSNQQKPIVINTQIPKSILLEMDEVVASGLVLKRAEFVRMAITEKLNRLKKKNFEEKESN